MVWLRINYNGLSKDLDLDTLHDILVWLHSINIMRIIDLDGFIRKEYRRRKMDAREKRRLTVNKIIDSPIEFDDPFAEEDSNEW